MHSKTDKRKWKSVKFEDGKIYFTRTAERRVFFVLTLLMLAAGFMIRFGVL